MQNKLSIPFVNGTILKDSFPALKRGKKEGKNGREFRPDTL